MLMTSHGRLARLYYLPGSYRVLSSGDHVICAVTRQVIPLADLRYWSAARQEPYADAATSMKAHGRG